MSFLEAIREARRAQPDPCVAQRDAERRFRTTNPAWYNVLTSMDVRVRTDGLGEITSRAVMDALGIPEPERQRMSKKVAHALYALGWAPATVGPAYARARGYTRRMRPA
jgi:hypothetical protein